MLIPQLYFILTGEAEFTEKGTEHDFQNFYNTRVQLLMKESQKQNGRFRELIDYFNAELFPDDDKVDPTSSMGDEEKALMKAIDEMEENEEGEGEDQAGSDKDNII